MYNCAQDCNQCLSHMDINMRIISLDLDLKRCQSGSLLRREVLDKPLFLTQSALFGKWEQQ